MTSIWPMVGISQIHCARAFMLDFDSKKFLITNAVKLFKPNLRNSSFNHKLMTHFLVITMWNEEFLQILLKCNFLNNAQFFVYKIPNFNLDIQIKNYINIFVNWYKQEYALNITILPNISILGIYKFIFTFTPFF